MPAVQQTKTEIYILNNSLQTVAVVKSLYPLNRKGMVLRYSRELSDYGECRFRISTKDPLLTEDILVPHQYHIRLKRGGVTIWSGVIVDNTERNRLYIEVVGVEYDYYFDQMLLKI